MSLETLGHGDAIADFDREFSRMAQNVADEKTCLGKRVVTLKVEVTPNESRDRCAIRVSCGSKLGGEKPVETAIHLRQEGDALVVSEEERQEKLDSQGQAGTA